MQQPTQRAHWQHRLAILVVLVGLVPAGAVEAMACPLQTEITASVCGGRPRPARPVRVALPEVEVAADGSSVPYPVAEVITAPVPIYTHPADFYANLPPVRQLEDGYLWVSVQSQTEFNGEAWYEINANEFVRSDKIAVTAPSSFQGVVVTAQPNAPFAFVLTWLQPLLEPGGVANAGAPALGRYNLVTIYEQRSYDGLLWYRIGEGQWIPQTAVGVIDVDLPPEGVAPGERWIEVDLFEQTLAAYEGQRLVYATLVSSGLKQWATDPGLFRIWVKLVKAKMSGREGFPDYYYIEDVPWIMYFNRDMALHGAYWHDRFGYPHSHGCVNLAPLDAQWLFNWTGPVVPEGEKAMFPTEADPGTWVWVHE